MGLEDEESIKGVKFMVMEGDQTSGGEHTIEYTAVML